jgi:hypothetical protein
VEHVTYPVPGTNPRKLFFGLILVGLIVIASVGSTLFVIERAGIIQAEVYVSGTAETNATQCHLYVDSEKVATESLRYYYGGYGNDDIKEFYFRDVKVKANVVHTFQVITTNGEESAVQEMRTPFGRLTRVTGISIFPEKVRLNVIGTNMGESTEDVTLYVDDSYEDIARNIQPGDTYSFSVDVSENQYHTFEIRTTYSGYTQNQTTVYIGTIPQAIYLDFE